MIIHHIILPVLSFFLFSSPVKAFELIAHKGVHQEVSLPKVVTFDPQGCPTKALIWRSHPFLENTIPSIKEAFRLGVDRVEIDLQFTKDGEVVLFHDSHLLCRTGVDSNLKDLTLSQLRNIDLAGGYRFLEIGHNPLKGTGRGKIATLKEVLTTFPRRGFVLNPKVDDEKFLVALTKILKELKRQGLIDLGQFSMWGSDKAWTYLKENFPELRSRLSHLSLSIACKEAYKKLGGFGIYFEQCQDYDLIMDESNLNDWNIWGGILGLRDFFHAHGNRIYIFQASSSEKLKEYASLQIDGVISSRVDVLLKDVEQSIPRDKK